MANACTHWEGERGKKNKSHFLQAGYFSGRLGKAFIILHYSFAIVGKTEEKRQIHGGKTQQPNLNRTR